MPSRQSTLKEDLSKVLSEIKTSREIDSEEAADDLVRELSLKTPSRQSTLKEDLSKVLSEKAADDSIRKISSEVPSKRSILKEALSNVPSEIKDSRGTDFEEAVDDTVRKLSSKVLSRQSTLKDGWSKGLSEESVDGSVRKAGSEVRSRRSTLKTALSKVISDMKTSRRIDSEKAVENLVQVLSSRLPTKQATLRETLSKVLYGDTDSDESFDDSLLKELLEVVVEDESSIVLDELVSKESVDSKKSFQEEIAEESPLKDKSKMLYKTRDSRELSLKESLNVSNGDKLLANMSSTTKRSEEIKENLSKLLFGVSSRDIGSQEEEILRKIVSSARTSLEARSKQPVDAIVLKEDLSKKSSLAKPSREMSSIEPSKLPILKSDLPRAPSLARPSRERSSKGVSKVQITLENQVFEIPSDTISDDVSDSKVTNSDEATVTEVVSPRESSKTSVVDEEFVKTSAAEVKPTSKVSSAEEDLVKPPSQASVQDVELSQDKLSLKVILDRHDVPLSREQSAELFKSKDVSTSKKPSAIEIMLKQEPEGLGHVISLVADEKIEGSTETININCTSSVFENLQNLETKLQSLSKTQAVEQAHACGTSTCKQENLPQEISETLEATLASLLKVTTLPSQDQESQAKETKSSTSTIRTSPSGCACEMLSSIPEELREPLQMVLRGLVKASVRSVKKLAEDSKSIALKQQLEKKGKVQESEDIKKVSESKRPVAKSPPGKRSPKHSPKQSPRSSISSKSNLSDKSFGPYKSNFQNYFLRAVYKSIDSLSKKKNVERELSEINEEDASKKVPKDILEQICYLSIAELENDVTKLQSNNTVEQRKEDKPPNVSEHSCHQHARPGSSKNVDDTLANSCNCCNIEHKDLRSVDKDDTTGAVKKEEEQPKQLVEEKDKTGDASKVGETIPRCLPSVDEESIITMERVKRGVDDIRLTTPSFFGSHESVSDRLLLAKLADRKSKDTLETTDHKSELEKLRDKMSDKEVFEKLLDSYEKEEMIVDRLSNDEEFFKSQLELVKSKESVETLFKETDKTLKGGSSRSHKTYSVQILDESREAIKQEGQSNTSSFSSKKKSKRSQELKMHEKLIPSERLTIPSSSPKSIPHKSYIQSSFSEQSTSSSDSSNKEIPHDKESVCEESISSKVSKSSPLSSKKQITSTKVSDSSAIGQKIEIKHNKESKNRIHKESISSKKSSVSNQEIKPIEEPKVTKSFKSYEKLHHEKKMYSSSDSSEEEMKFRKRPRSSVTRKSEEKFLSSRSLVSSGSSALKKND
ncbi:hypothetical protein ILUMI_20857 [Ignelater luminosus]|uniref:Uncharacterized protein n=1 Tax=Ignelater luminosus TaxID=2038154 RepID=A0A8K0CK15_IGNLU|nr:hypothetical protein ILUMI_20857 [Ignelater luminosus]